MLRADQLFALSVFGCYFGVIILLFIVVLRSMPWRQPRQKGRHALVYGSLAVFSLAHTWYYMIRFLLVRLASGSAASAGTSNTESLSQLNRTVEQT